MPRSASADAHTYVVHATFLSGEDPFATETYTLLLPPGHDVAAAAQALAESSRYWDNRIPDLAKRVLFVPVDQHDPGRLLDRMTMIVDHVGLFLVLSTSHVRCATGQLFDRWAEIFSPGRPFAPAASLLGWFVPTADIGADTMALLPVELPPILAFARSLGCSYILFDYDAQPIADLPTFPW